MVRAFNTDILTHMNLGKRMSQYVAGLGLSGVILLFTTVAPAADSLTWHKGKDSVDADISSWSVIETLKKIAEATE